MLTHQNKCLEISHVQLAKFYLETERVIMFCFVYTRPPAWEARFANMLGPSSNPSQKKFRIKKE